MSLHHHPDHSHSGTDENRQRPQQDDEPGQPGFWRSKAGLVAVAFLLIAAFFLLSEHRAHALGALPYLIILACPLLHIFMHRGHGSHGGHAGGDEDGRQPLKESER